MQSFLASGISGITLKITNMKKKFSIGIDLGGTKVEAIVLDNKNNILMRERVFTEGEKGPDHVINQIFSLYTKSLKSIKNNSHTIGIGTPGSISKSSNLLKNSNILSLNGLPFKKLIEEKIQNNIIIENDANCFALAEALMGAGKGYSCVFGVIMGTGVGGGIVINKKIWQGPQNIAGEWGHTVIDPQGPRCFCGAKGCIGCFISGAGLEKKIYIETGKKISAQNFFKLKVINSQFKEIKQDFFERYGQALANLINILDPNIVILGGGLSNINNLYTKGTQEVYKRIFTDTPSTPIVKNKLGDSAGVIGAAFLGKEETTQ